MRVRIMSAKPRLDHFSRRLTNRSERFAFEPEPAPKQRLGSSLNHLSRHLKPTKTLTKFL